MLWMLWLHIISGLCLYADFVPAGSCTVCLTTSQWNHSRTKSVHHILPPTSLLSGWFMSAHGFCCTSWCTTPDSGPQYKLFFACFGISLIQEKHSSWTLHIHLSSLCTHRKQVQQVCVGIDARRGGLDLRQLLKDGVQLLGLSQVNPRFLFVCPVWQRHVHGYKVFQVHAEDRESKAWALGETLAVLTVVPTWCHQFDEIVKDLQVEWMQGDEINLEGNIG